MATVLGISCFFHDAAAAIIVDGRVVAAAEEERFSRQKHDARLPLNAIRFCLTASGVARPDYVAFYERPVSKLDRILTSATATLPGSRRALVSSLRSWTKDRLWIATTLASTLKVHPNRIVFVDHHHAHAASALYASPFPSAALLTIDGVGEWNTASIGMAHKDHSSTGSLRLTRTMDFPHSLGLLYSAFTQYLGFEVNEGEFKVMGLAAFGKPKYRDELSRLVTVYADGSLWLDMKYFAFHYSDATMFNERFTDLLGYPARQLGQPYRFAEIQPAQALHDDDQPYADIAASIQELCEDVVVGMAKEAYRQSGLDDLCYAGGVALNGAANTKILTRTPVKRLYIPAAPGDAGAAMGAAFYCYHDVLGHRATDQTGFYLGQEFTDDDIARLLSQRGITSRRYDNIDHLLARVVGCIAAGQVIGWFQGRFEWGPRALGNRSILADPRLPHMKELINAKVKYREQFRPFAPSLLAERAQELLSVDVSGQTPAELMLLVLPLQPDAADSMPAASHFGTARVQVVTAQANPLFHRLVTAFYNQTGVPALLNTSFNIRGEPMVASPAHALKTFENSGLDLLVMGNHVISKT